MNEKLPGGAGAPGALGYPMKKNIHKIIIIITLACYFKKSKKQYGVSTSIGV